MQEEHDIQANRSVAKVLILGSGVCLFVILLGYLGVARIPLAILWKDFGLAALLLALPFIYLKVKSQPREWFKYGTLICTIGAVIVLYSDFEISRYVTTALLVPLIVAAIYYDPRLTVVVGAGQSLEVDMAARTVFLITSAGDRIDQFGSITAGSEFWALQPGTNLILIESDEVGGVWTIAWTPRRAGI